MHLSNALLLVRTLTISLGSVITSVNNQILWSVVVLATQIALQDSLGAVCVSLLGIEGGTGHVRNHCVSAAEWVLCVSEWVVLWCWLREPDVSSITAEVAGLESICDILLDDDRTTGSVDEP